MANTILLSIIVLAAGGVIYEIIEVERYSNAIPQILPPIVDITPPKVVRIILSSPDEPPIVPPPPKPPAHIRGQPYMFGGILRFFDDL